MSCVGNRPEQGRLSQAFRSGTAIGCTSGTPRLVVGAHQAVPTLRFDNPTHRAAAGGLLSSAVRAKDAPRANHGKRPCQAALDTSATTDDAATNAPIATLIGVGPLPTAMLPRPHPPTGRNSEPGVQLRQPGAYPAMPAARRPILPSANCSAAASWKEAPSLMWLTLCRTYVRHSPCKSLPHLARCR